jgi:menaquinone-specific isochorismate synthase
MTPEVAFLESGDGRVLLGRGPFEPVPEPPGDGGVAFYWGGFDLSGGGWRVPAGGVEEFGGLEAMAAALDGLGEAPEVRFAPADWARFRAQFDAIGGRLRAGSLEKAVPVAVLEGTRVAGRMRSLLGRLAGEPPELRAYGLFGGGGGMLGATPEVLFRLAGREVESMALAGTAGRGAGRSLAGDPKQEREQRIVAEHLRSRLSEFGDVEVSGVEELDVGALSHLVTRFRFRVGGEIDPGRLIARLHPTPAVGTSPAGEDATGFLRALRAEAGVPEMFAAPFGVSRAGCCEVLVAIRAVFWEGDRVAVPAGCGVIAESAYEREREELELKWGAVRELFAI